ncbi:MAG: hypothetical protein ACOCG5_01125 [Candidatus Alkaliphilus sp. MAG34]
MRKTRFLALTLAVVLVLMGAGYAYWTEAIKIDATVKTGKLDFAFEGLTVSSDSEFLNTGGSRIGHTGTGKDNLLVLEFVNSYPGAEAEVKFNMVNNGTIPLKVTGFNYNITYPTSQDEITKFMNHIQVRPKLPVETKWMSLSRYVGYLNDPPFHDIGVGGEILFELEFRVNPDAENQDLPQSKTFKLNINAVAKQYNDPGES